MHPGIGMPQNWTLVLMTTAYTVSYISFFCFVPVLVDDQMSDQEDTETSASTLPRPRSVTEGSAFDENSLNQPQFIHLLEKFLGHTPIK